MIRLLFLLPVRSFLQPELQPIRTEIAQLAGEFQHKTSYRPTLPKFSRLEEAWYLMPTSNVVDIEALPNLADQNFHQEIKSCAAVLQKIDLDVFAVDVTHPEIGIPVVYVIIPGAHFMDRTRENSVAYHAARLISQYHNEERALAEMERMADLFGDRYEVRFFLGFICERNGLTEKALSHYETALKMEPRDVDLANIYCHIGIIYRNKGAYEKAIEIFNVAQGHNDSLKEIYQQLGFCYFKTGEFEKAIEEFEKALEIDPGSAIDYANIAANLKALGHLQMAIPIYEMALEIDPDLEFARNQLNQIKTTHL